MASLEGRHQTATINEKKAIANLEQIKRHPNAAVVASTSKADDEVRVDLSCPNLAFFRLDALTEPEEDPA
jgi:hypothetical protein